ncbi:MAG: hypothetical protein ACR2P4_10530 [Gammaproteobacteria bacterium]
MRFFSPLLLCVFAAFLAACAPPKSDYAGLETRAIKALSAAETTRYQKGEGGGDALAAELNGFAGPKHVLEFAEQLQLTPLQLRQTRDLFARMQKESRAYGAALIEEEQRLDAFFAEGGGDDLQMLTILGTIGKLRALVRYAHLSAHLRQNAILDEEQRLLYIELRGYHNHNDDH